MLSARQPASIKTGSVRSEMGSQSRVRIHFRQVFTPSLRIFVPGERNLAPRFRSALQSENYPGSSSPKLFRIAD
jgi:hypothetical protein